VRRYRRSLPALAGIAMLVTLLGVGLTHPSPSEAASSNDNDAKDHETRLLFPFLTNQAGFDSAVAIANTTSDPFGTEHTDGTCVLTFYGNNAPPPITTPTVLSGSNYTFLASTSAPNFQGYMIAVCGFPLAHGFAFVSDTGAKTLATSYLAVVLDEHRGTPESRGS